MTLRVIVRTDDAGMPANVGGSVLSEFKTFDIDVPELESFLREYTDRSKTGTCFWQRQIIGVDVLPAPETENAK
jgi:hypothetical protein